MKTVVTALGFFAIVAGEMWLGLGTLALLDYFQVPQNVLTVGGFFTFYGLSLVLMLLALAWWSRRRDAF